MKAIKWVLIGTLLAVAFAGCYTRLVHPPVTDESGTYYHPRKNCSDCHSSADYYYYHFPYGSYYGRGGRYWNSYYRDPWWYHDYWNWDNQGEGLPTGETHYWDQRVRPESVPKLPASAGETNNAGERTPSVPGATQGSETKESPKSGDSGSRYSEPRKRPEPPKQEPKEKQKEEKKAEDKK